MKIYISKSKQGNPDDVAKVRHYLEKLNCEIIEFFGGEYSPNALLASDVLIVVPPVRSSDDEFRVGKGQCTEIENFRGEVSETDTFIVKAVDTDDMFISHVDTVYLIEEDWQKNWAEVTTLEDTYEFQDVYGLSKKPVKKTVDLKWSDIDPDCKKGIDQTPNIMLALTRFGRR